MRKSHYCFLLFVFLVAVLSTAYSQTALQLAPVTPCRLVDTRPPNGNGAFQGTMTFDLRTLAQSGGAYGTCTPFDLSTAQAYSLNVTVLPATTLNYLTIWPAGQPMPTESLMNSYDGRIKANAAIVPGGSNGEVSVFVTDHANVLIDINAYFDPSGSNLQFFPLPPCRIVDTRMGQDGGTLQAGTERDFPIPGQGLTGNCGVPANASAYSFNVTALPTHGRLFYMTVWPQGETMPTVSTLNDLTGTIVANAAIVPSGQNNATAFYVTDDTDLLVDTNGYFAPLNSNQPVPPLSLYTLSPCRVLDTRPPGGSGPFQGTLTVQMVNNSNGCAIPSAAAAYVVNATAVPDPVLGYLTLWGQGTQPIVSTLNAYDGAVTSNMAIVPANTSDGTMLAYASNNTNLIVDAFSVMAPPVTLMRGNYAFAVRGYQTVNNLPTPFVLAGGLVADGQGGITSGVLDLNTGSGSPMNGTSFTGTYSIDGTGVGTMQLNTGSQILNFHVALSAQGNGQIIWDDADPNPRGSGMLLQQNPADFTYPPQGNYAIGTLGSDFAQKRYAAAGAFTVGANGFVSSGSEDVNDGGTLQSSTFTGGFAHGINTLGGRNVASFTFMPSGTTNNYAYYTIVQGYVLLISIDATAAQAPLTLGTILVQPTSVFTNAALQGATVYGTSALAPNNGNPVADVLLGLANWGGNGNGTFSLDENSGGTITQQEMSSGTYAVNSNGINGRVSLSGFTGTPPILYLINTNQAFILGQDASVAFGMLQPQSGSQFSNSSISGTYLGGTINPAQASLVDSVAHLQADGNGNLTGFANTSGPSGLGTQPYSNTYQVDSTGRAVLGNGTPGGIMYVVSPTQLELLPSGSNPVLSLFTTGAMN